MRVPRALASSTRAPSIISGGSASPAGEAVPRLPPIVPRLRICGEPTVRDGRGERGQRRGQLAARGLRVGQSGAQHELVALAPPAAQLRHAPEVDQGVGPLAPGVERDHEIGAARDRAHPGVRGAQAERIFERARCIDLHGYNTRRDCGRTSCPRGSPTGRPSIATVRPRSSVRAMRPRSVRPTNGLCWWR